MSKKKKKLFFTLYFLPKYKKILHGFNTFVTNARVTPQWFVIEESFSLMKCYREVLEYDGEPLQKTYYNNSIA